MAETVINGNVLTWRSGRDGASEPDDRAGAGVDFEESEESVWFLSCVFSLEMRKDSISWHHIKFDSQFRKEKNGMQGNAKVWMNIFFLLL